MVCERCSSLLVHKRFQRHSSVRKVQRFQRRSLVPRHIRIRKVQQFQRRSLEHIRYHKVPFLRRTMDRKPKCHSKSWKHRSLFHRADGSKGHHRSFDR